MKIDAASIRTAALRTDGTARPSGIDARGWRRICTSFHSASNDLCHSLALLARRHSTVHVDPQGLAPLMACRLFALDKCPGVRPIGICETARRIIAKAVLHVTRDDVLDAAGTIQLCAGQTAGTEAAAHAMDQAFQAREAEAVLLVDASNAFNSLNRHAALLNIRHICPSPSSSIPTDRPQTCTWMAQPSFPKRGPRRVTPWPCPCTPLPSSHLFAESMAVSPIPNIRQ